MSNHEWIAVTNPLNAESSTGVIGSCYRFEEDLRRKVPAANFLKDFDAFRHISLKRAMAHRSKIFQACEHEYEKSEVALA